MESDTAEREQRFTELYERCYGSVYAYAARRAGRESADEIAAETFVIAWRRFESLPAEPLPWLYGVARNVVMRLLAARERESRTLVEVVNELAISVGTGFDGGGDQRLWEAWERLSARDREVLALVAWEELSVPEAAVVLDCSAPAFSVRLHRARRRLARLLAATEQMSSSPLWEVRS
jgi:RNA polymerase sigma-70 factor (ECF subfamily)